MIHEMLLKITLVDYRARAHSIERLHGSEPAQWNQIKNCTITFHPTSILLGVSFDATNRGDTITTWFLFFLAKDNLMKGVLLNDLFKLIAKRENNIQLTKFGGIIQLFLEDIKREMILYHCVSPAWSLAIPSKRINNFYFLFRCQIHNVNILSSIDQFSVHILNFPSLNRPLVAGPHHHFTKRSVRPLSFVFMALSFITMDFYSRPDTY